MRGQEGSGHPMPRPFSDIGVGGGHKRGVEGQVSGVERREVERERQMEEEEEE